MMTDADYERAREEYRRLHFPHPMDPPPVEYFAALYQRDLQKTKSPPPPEETTGQVHR